ncbi:MAG TPA: YceI family protein [Jatrophihabitantaceae bacterium]|jgi:polyisoprenoid-binding protein YceI
MTTTTQLGRLTGEYVLDATQTRLGFATRQTFSKVRGQFDDFDGRVHLDGDDPSRSSAQIAIRTSSIQTRNGRRDDHLRRSFLNVARHPTITFTSTRIEQVDETRFRVRGDLTIRSVIKAITVDLALTSADEDRVTFEGTATIDRRPWGVVWSTAVEGGGAVVSNKVALEFDVVAVRQPPTAGG